ncbi:Beta-lactamase enzyme family protein [Muriicola jejuensis]|uniref:Beta-lactamase class A catalytic domain-containing protein n=2 Tax=Muriicola jejuensis TaxID=504488 RepID=A0A6P0U7M1_9FLAO|nr:hypothetical protein [Muriicola jejuensis]SMP10856.1 Beta-lactamase enzyme family protein [Muriicola jejuensis]
MITCLLGCSGDQPPKDPLDQVLSSEDPRIRKVMENPEPYEVQIRYTQIDRKGDSLVFRDFDYQVDKEEYFYPASTVKFPIAVLAMEKVNRSSNLDLNTRFYVEGDTLETTFGKEIIKIFAVSDNAANNRLLEFLGQDAINEAFRKKNIGPARISHRLSVPDADEVTTKPLVVYLNDSTTTVLPRTFNTPPKPLELKGVTKGKGFYEEDTLMEMPFDFSLKNYYPIDTQHEVLKRVIFPEAYPQVEQFHLSRSQRTFLLDAMKILPRQAGYDPVEYYDSYGKFFLFGDTQKPMPEHIKIYNKVGYAYGTLTDCAYVRDEQNGVEFLITATILVNEDQIFNDNEYEYDETGIPFLAALGEGLYQIELNRKR